MTIESKNPSEASLVIVRDARLDDAPMICELLVTLGYPSTLDQVARRITACMASADSTVLVAQVMEGVVGVLSFHCIPLFHADGSLGRITSLVVSPYYRQRGVGRSLVVAAEDFGRAHNCLRIEVTSGDHRPEAHAFYEHLGYRLDCRRFIKHSRTA